MAELTVPRIDFSSLGDLPQLWREGQNRQRLSDLGRGLADGSVNYRAAAGQVADMGDITHTLQFLALAEAEKKRGLEQQASADFNKGVGGMFGAQPAPASSMPNPMPVPGATPPSSVPRAPVQPSSRVWGDKEAEDAGLYEPSARPTSLAALNPTAQAPAPRAAAPAPTPQAEPTGQVGAQHIPALIGALSNPNLPSGQKETAKLLLTEAFKNSKEPERVQLLDALKKRPDLLEIEKQLRAQTTVNVDQKGETELSKTLNKGLGERINDIAKEGDAARTDLAMVGQLRDLGAAVKTGGGAAVQGWLANYGIKVGGNVGAVEAYGAIVDKLTPNQRVPGSGSSSDVDVRMFKSSLPRLINTPEGNEIIENTLAGAAQYKLERAAIADKVQSGELGAKEALKQMRELPNPYANFKSFAKNGFKADPSDPASTGSPDFSSRFDAARPGSQGNRTKTGIQWSVE